MRAKLSRRTVLRGLGVGGAVTVALPLLDAMVGRSSLLPKAAGQPLAAPARFIQLHWPQGMPVGWNGDSFFFPTRAGTGWDATPALQPLVDAGLRADVNIVSGLSYAPIRSSLGDSHGHAPAAFTGYASVLDGGRIVAAGPSADQIAAGRIGTSTRFGSLSTGLYNQGDYANPWSGAGAAVSLEISPARLFDRVFGDLALPTDEAGERARQTRSVLDFVQTDIEALSSTLGADDRTRLDEHLTSIREIERAVLAPPAADCAAPPAPGDVAYGDGDATEYAHLMMDLAALALRCDLTRVAYVSLGGIWRTYPHLGVMTDYHNVCHTGFNPAASSGPRLDDDRELAADYYRRIGVWHIEQVAYFLTLLKAPDATGASLLDNSVFVAMTEFGDGGLHGDSYVPVIAAGTAGGMRGGSNLAFRCDFAEAWQEAPWCSGLSGTANRSMNDLWQAALVGVGALDDGDRFGDPGLATRALEGLWAG